MGKYIRTYRIRTRAATDHQEQNYGHAVTALIFSIISLFGIFLFSILGIIMGVTVLLRIKKDNRKKKETALFSLLAIIIGIIVAGIILDNW